MLRVVAFPFAVGTSDVLRETANVPDRLSGYRVHEGQGDGANEVQTEIAAQEW